MSVPTSLAQVRATRPLVDELARALSLAASIDVAIARRLRVRLVRDAGASTEGELWTSSLVQTRGVGALALRGDVLAAYWSELAGDRARLDEIWTELDAARDGAPPLLRLEEKLTYLGLVGDAAAIERELGAVARAMLDEPDRRRDLAAWSARALARLPAPVRDAEAARALADAARGWVATPTILAAVAPRTPEYTSLARRLIEGAAMLRIEVRRVGNQLEIARGFEPPGIAFDIPAVSPRLILDDDVVVAVDLRGVTRATVTSPTVRIRTTDGRRWLLGPAQPPPALGAIALVPNGSPPGVAYLVAPRHAITSARVVADEPPWQGTLVFGGRTIAARVVGLDPDADIALIELDEPAPVAPLALARSTRPGDAWQVYGLSGGSGNAIVRGTVSTADPDLRLWSASDDPTGGLFVAGLPVFSDGKVIGHLRGVASTDGILPATSARLVAWWLDQADLSRCLVRVASSSSGRRGTLGALIAPRLIVAPFAATGGEPTMMMTPLSPAPLSVAMVGRSVHITSSATIYELESDATGTVAPVTRSLPADGDIVEIVSEAGTLRGRCQHLRTGTPPTSRVTFEEGAHADASAALFFRGAFAGFLGGKAADGPTMVTWLDDDVARWLHDREETIATGVPPAVWIQTIQPGEPPTEISFFGSQKIKRRDRIVAFSPEQQTPLRIAIYEIVTRRWYEESAEANCRLLVALPPITPELGDRDLIAVRSSTAQWDTRRLGIHDRLVRLLRNLFGSSADPAIELLGGGDLAAPPSSQTRPVLVEIEQHVSTAGLLATQLASDGGIRRFERHASAEHRVDLVLPNLTPPPSDALFFSISTSEDPLSVPELQVIANDEALGGWTKTEIQHAFGLARAQFRSLAQRGGRARGVHVRVRRLPGVSREHALRRGIRFVTAVLAHLDAGTETVRLVHLRVPGIARLDLDEANRRFGANARTQFRIAAIDPDADLVDVVLFGDAARSDAADLFSAAFGMSVAATYMLGDDDDELAGTFGFTERRAGRTLTVSSSGDVATVEVAAIDGVPVRGYVTFYAPQAIAPPVRIRASAGIARATFPVGDREYTVGAVIEDEHVLLENHVAAAIAPPRP